MSLRLRAPDPTSRHHGVYPGGRRVDGRGCYFLFTYREHNWDDILTATEGLFVCNITGNIDQGIMEDYIAKSRQRKASNDAGSRPHELGIAQTSNPT